MLASIRPVVQLGQRELQHRQGARLRGGFGDEVGDDTFVERHAGACSREHHGVVELGRRQGRQDECAVTRRCPNSGCWSGRSNMSARHSSRRPARSRGRRSVMPAITVEELASRPPSASRPALLELVDHDHQPVRLAGDVADDDHRIAARLRLGRHLGQRLRRALRPERRRRVIMATVYPSRRSRGTRPARTTELLPEPDAPTTVTNGCVRRPARPGPRRPRRVRRTLRRRPDRTGAAPCTG